MSTSSSSSSSSLPYLLLSVLFHLLYLSSIFQIYFTSPVVHPSNRYSLIDTYPQVQLKLNQSNSTSTQKVQLSNPPAERLVLIVGDGLRADTVFGKHDFNSLPDWARFQLINSSDSSSTNQDQQQPSLPFPNALLYDRTLSCDEKLQLEGYEKSKSLTNGQAKKEKYQVAPYLRRMALERGAWGISHTRVPTESRPGHVAMIAGMYEDVSAVTKGWKQNPLPFDSVLNQSSNTFAFGSPDIVPMFSRGATEGKVRQWCYKEEDEDFTRDATHLDLWVLNEFRNLLNSSKTSPSLKTSLEEKGNIFFLHLLGPDTTGHTYRPFSPEYLGNSIVVDSIVEEVENLIKDFFNDEKTVFVFTADHGMSRLGNHGDGEPDNTRTPLIAWGSGIRTPRLVGDDKMIERNGRLFGVEESEGKLKGDKDQNWRIEQRAKDEYFRGWDEFDKIWREDVEQGDITPLMASLLSLPQPANSEGRLPLDYFDPSLGEEHKARASLANALQVLESYRVKDAQRSSRSLSYQPFPSLPPGSSPFRLPGSFQVSQIKSMIATKKYSEALSLCDELITSSLKGAQYLQTYDWLLLVTVVTFGYLGSFFYGITFISRKYSLSSKDLKTCDESLGIGSFLSSIGFIIISLKYFLEKSPLTYYLYSIFPAFFWGRVIDQRKVFLILLRRIISSNSDSISNISSSKEVNLSKSKVATKVFFKLVIPSILSLFALELMVIGYLHRIAWSIGFLILGFLWPFWGWSSDIRRRNEALVIVWGGVCLVTAMFTLAGTEKEESRIGLALSGLVFFLAGTTVLSYPSLFLSASDENSSSRLIFWKPVKGSPNQQLDPHLDRTVKVLGAELMVLIISTLVTLSSSRSLQLKRGLPLFNQIIGWGVLASCLTFPFLIGFQSPIPISISSSSSSNSDSNRISKSNSNPNPNKLISQPISQRLSIFIFAFAPIFILLSLRDETLFFFSFILTLLIWSKVEGTLFEEYEREEMILEIQRRKVLEKKFDVDNNVDGGKSMEDNSNSRMLKSSEIRTSLTFLFLLHVGFFGTGNVASISSFYLSPVYRLVPIFNPFLMATLLLLKILVPFIVLSSIFQVLCLSPIKKIPSLETFSSSTNYSSTTTAFASTSTSSTPNLDETEQKTDTATETATETETETERRRKTKATELEGPTLLGSNSSGGLGLKDSFSLTLIACLFTDVLALNFLFNVRTNGSWLEIGRTITHFAMANLLQIFMLLLNFVSERLIGKG